MNELQIKGNLKEIEGKLKKKYGTMIGDDKMLAEGKIEEFIGMVALKTCKTKETILKELDSIS